MYHQKRLLEEYKDIVIYNLIKEIFELHKQRYGYRRITMELNELGYKVNHKKVLRIMRRSGLKCTKFGNRSRKYNSYLKGSENKINQRFYTPIPRQKITTDTTDFKYYTVDKNNKLKVGKLYLDPFMDMFNGEIISYSINNVSVAQPILEAQNKAIQICLNECEYHSTFHSDGDWAYKMINYQEALKDNKIFQIMSSKATSTNNSPMDNFFGLLKQEMHYGETYHSYEQLKMAIEEYIEYYNIVRRKEKLGDLSPVKYRKMMIA